MKPTFSPFLFGNPVQSQLGLPVFVLMALVLLAGCNGSAPQADLTAFALDSYQPIEQFVPAYTAISNQQQLQQGRDYDLEKTVRMMNVLELAQAKSDSFEEFLDFVSRQDFTGVAPDVLKAKVKLLPVLEYTYKLRSQDQQLSDVWMLVRGAARGGQTLVRNTSASELFRLVHGDVFALIGIASGESADRSTNEVFAQYEKDKELKSRLRADLAKLRTSYRQYMEDYAPIYEKYMAEYDRLCVEKDHAYLDLYAGHTDEALLHAEHILSKYPANAEAMLLKAMSLVLLGGGEAPQTGTIVRNSESGVYSGGGDSLSLAGDTMQLAPHSALTRQAMQTLQDYKQRYPDRTAPALVLEGLICQQQGDSRAALSRFHQASIEYPRQAAQLTDMLDAYNTRNYLAKTPEGQYLRRLYASTMEGYGLFSPNLLKAKYYADQGQMEKSREEIYNHFFRRGNQGIYDELLSDMQFCEENLYGPFKSLLLEQSYIDVEIAPESKWLFWSSDDVVRVKIRNRSDKDLENVRIFLCIHYTDMYKDEYDVVKVPRTASRIEHHSTADFDTLTLHYPGKGFNDIARVRAIAMTDDRISWVDDVKYKRNHILSVLQAEAVQTDGDDRRKDYLSHYSLSPEKLERNIRDGLKVLPPEDDPQHDPGWWERIVGWFSPADNNLKLELPRVLIMTDPVFSVNPIDSREAHAPTQNELHGTAIRLSFDFQPQYDQLLPLYIYSDVASFRADIRYKGAASEVVAVEQLFGSDNGQ